MKDSNIENNIANILGWAIYANNGFPIIERTMFSFNNGAMASVLYSNDSIIVFKMTFYMETLALNYFI